MIVRPSWNTSWNKGLLWIALLVLLQGCGTTPLTPSQTAQQFWTAVLNEDADQAADYCTRQSAPLLTGFEQFHQATISVGQVSIQSNQATVETTLQAMPAQSSSSTAATTFITYLEREQGQWRVDYRQTRDSLDKSKEKKGIGKIVDDLNQLGRHFSEKIDQSMKQWQEATPQLKKDLKSLGDSAQRQAEDAIEKYGPEIQQNLQDLSQSLEDALRKLEESVPRKVPDQSPQQEQAVPEATPQDEAPQSQGRMI